MSSCCPVCYRATEEKVRGSREGEKLQKRFFQLFERYLNQDKINNEQVGGINQSGDHFTPSALAGAGLVSCGQCLQLMESFCELFHQLKTTELLIAWKVETLKNVMECAGKVPSRNANLRNFMNGMEVPERVDEVVEARRSLIDNCYQKLRNSFPKLSIEKWMPDEETCPEWSQQSGQTKISKLVDNINNEGQQIGTHTQVAKPNLCDARAAEKALKENVLPTLLSAPTVLDDRSTSAAKVKECPAPTDHEADVQHSKQMSFGLPQDTINIGTGIDNYVAPPETEAHISETLLERDDRAEKGHNENGLPVLMMSTLALLEDQVTSNAEIEECLTYPDGDDNNDQQSTHVSDHGQTQNRDREMCAESDTYVAPPANTEAPVECPLLESKPTFKMESIVIEGIPGHDTEALSITPYTMLIPVETPPDLPVDVPSNTPNQVPHQSPSGQISRLRSTYRCPNCDKTFSSSTRLQLHIQDFHPDEHGSDNELSDDEINNDAYESDSDSDSMCLASSSSDEQEDYPDYESKCNSDSVHAGGSKTPRSRLLAPAQPNQAGDFNPGAAIRIKCPDCAILSPDVKDFLLHRKTSKSCRDIYDPTATVKVEVLSLPKDVKTKAKLNDSKFVDVLAIVDLPQEIHICESCDVAVYSLEDMEAHMKLHGSFQCNFCDVMEPYAPYLALHEIEEHFPKKRADGKPHNQHFNCPRCGFGCKYRTEYFAHHLSAHLSLAFKDIKCTICRTTSEWMIIYQPGTNQRIKFRIGAHLKMYHDLSSVTNEDDIKKCELDNCSAYFLTAAQLSEHQKLPHDLQAPKSHSLSIIHQPPKLPKRSITHSQPGIRTNYRLKCPDCDGLFLSTSEILAHRKTSDSCSSLFDPSTNVRVQVLLPPDPSNKNKNPDGGDTRLTRVDAIVDLPQAILICDIENCGVVQYSQEDMEVHKNLHGTFHCNFCDVTESYAPELALHEIEEHFPKTRIDGKPHNWHFNCPRCGFGCKQRTEYFVHHLSVHLSLTFKDIKCAICKTTSDFMIIHQPGRNKRIKFEIGAHLKTHHDLSKVTNVENLKRCEFENCRAYFLTAQQLREHKKLHGCQVQSQSHYRLKCPDCYALFCSPEEILTHRKASNSCSGAYDPSKSVKVEVLVPLGPEYKAQDGDETLFTTVEAIIDLPQEIFVCDIENCGAVQYSSEDMETHKGLHGSFPCKFCKVKLSSAPKLSIHELQHFKKEKSEKGSNTTSLHFCPRCDFKCIQRPTYIRHHMTSHLSLTVNEAVCPICKTHCTNLSSNLKKLTSHFKNMHDVSKVTIPEDILHCTVPSCNAYFLFPNQLTEHLSLRHNLRDRRYVKPGTIVNLPKYRSRRGKNEIISGERWKRGESHKCKDCGKTYVVLRELWVHRVKHHVDPDKAIHCTVPKCEKVFESTKQLAHHIKFATKYHKTLDCPDVQCPKCDKSISGSNPSHLTTHLKTHEWGALPFCCELCGKAFKNKTRLNKHLLVHSGPESWKFECSICGLKAKDKSKLTAHMRRHTKEKPYVCQICGLKYADRHNLRFHVNSKHGDVMEDKARTYDKTNLTSKKGVKRKRKSNVESEADDDERDSDNDTN